MGLFSQASTLTVVLHVVIVLGVAVRVIMLRAAPGVALAWLLLVAVVPLFGLLLYVSIGERRIGQRRAKRYAQLRTDFDELGTEYVHEHMTDVAWSSHPPESRAMDRLGRKMVGIPTLTGNRLALHSDTQEMLRAIARDIDGAQSSVGIEFYIWHAGGTADEVLEAVIRAAQRGVRCRVLIDDVGAAPWWRGEQPGRLRDAGVAVRPALRVGPIRGFLQRNDLRLHRKIVVVDGRVAWTGSMNLVDPRHFKQDAGVGEWIDAMVRVEGNAVLPLGATLAADWQMETGDEVRGLLTELDLHAVQRAGDADIQVVPSGPGSSGDAILQMILGLVYTAREELVLTTPYFVPDDSMLRGLRGAAARGVDVELVVPAKVDSLLVRYASRSYYDDLMDAGVKIRPFGGGLLHTKSITVDGEAAMIGTVNLDMRSLWLNYEVSLFVYDRDFTGRVRDLQQSYLDASTTIDAGEWGARPFGPRFVENTFRLVSPLL